MRKSLITSAISLLALATSAFATPITGTSTGTLTNRGASTLTVTQETPYKVSWTNPGNQTTHLTAGVTNGTDAIAQDFATLGGDAVKLASLNWANVDNANNKSVFLDWKVTVNLADPSYASPLPTNSLDISLKNGSHTDTIILDSLASLSWTFGTWVVDNFRYVTSNGNLDDLAWTSTMGTNSTLWIEADFRNTYVPPTSAPVPEPGTMMLLGAGFLGLAVYGKRRKNA